MGRLIATALFCLWAAHGGRAQMVIKGAGSSFDYPIFAAWFSAYAKVDPALTFDYQPVGSGGGIRQIVEQSIDFGASDAPMTDEALAKAPGKILHLPVVSGGVAVVYNLLDGPKLRLDAETLSGIFIGKIRKWNDPRIASLNADADLPDYDITVIHRSDGSGTTYIFTDYLSRVRGDWRRLVGKGMSVDWPLGRGANGNGGVAAQVSQLPGAIGYAELSYARKNQLQYADLRNSSGNFITPDSASISAALAIALVSWDLRFSIVNSIGKNAYPIAGASWVLIYSRQSDARKGRKLVQFLRWAVTDGQSLPAGMNYAPLTANMVRQVLGKLDGVTYGGGALAPE